MASYNKVILMGNLTRDPQLRYLPSQTPVVEIGLAVSRRFKKQDGTQGEEVCFIDCSAFGKTAENINKFFTKGRPILVEGRLQLDSWQAQDGSKRSKHRVFIESFQFVDSRAGGGGGAPGGAGPRESASVPPPADRGEPMPPEPYDDGGYEAPAGGGGGGDHIPF
ncbi:MAG: single-stranded DNA-binding protein [Planctomycetota bacterium]|nr:single-stranded DNA-binding protein [Planctomycetota bacterium]